MHPETIATAASADLTLMVGSTAKTARPLPKDLPEVLCGRYRIERLLKSDVKYRFVIDMKSLKQAG